MRSLPRGPTSGSVPTGTDTSRPSAPTPQYLYHERWRKRRDQEKFDHALDFARTLPRVRAETAKHLALEGLPAERVLACATRLFDRSFFRIGSESYAEQNGSYGLATMKKQHASVDGDEVVFDYVAKGGKHRIQSIVDPSVAKVVRALKRRRGGGSELLAYRTRSGWHDVRSNDINEYIRELTGESSRRRTSARGTLPCSRQFSSLRPMPAVHARPPGPPGSGW